MRYLGPALLVLLVIACGVQPPTSPEEICDAELMRSHRLETVITHSEGADDDAQYFVVTVSDGDSHGFAYYDPYHKDLWLEGVSIEGEGQYIRRWDESVAPDEWGRWIFNEDTETLRDDLCDFSPADEVVYEGEDWIDGDRTFKFSSSKLYEDLPVYRLDLTVWINQDGLIVLEERIQHYKDIGYLLERTTYSEHGKKSVIEAPDLNDEP